MLTLYTLLESHLRFQCYQRKLALIWLLYRTKYLMFYRQCEKGYSCVSNKCLYNTGGNTNYGGGSGVPPLVTKSKSFLLCFLFYC